MVTFGFNEVGGVLAPDGRIKSFSSDADGYARSEGGGMVVLKRVADARRDGDEILAVIAGSAVNHDGRSNGMLAPNPDAQGGAAQGIPGRRASTRATVDYIGAHGTGTILGDPIEADALGRVVGRGRAADKPALLGAVKSNVGHLESAAGAPASPRWRWRCRTTSCRRRSTTRAPTRTSTSTRNTCGSTTPSPDWPRYSGHDRRVSGFGFGGANAHLVLREVLPSDLVEPEPVPKPGMPRRESERRTPYRRRRPDGRVASSSTMTPTTLRPMGTRMTRFTGVPTTSPPA